MSIANKYPNETLLAKSIGDVRCDSATLPGHLVDVYQSANAIVNSVGGSMLEAIGLESDIWLDRLRISTLFAAAIHDLGKANNHFQKAVWGLAEPTDRQPIRHEWISVWIASQADMKKWLLPGRGRL